MSDAEKKLYAILSSIFEMSDRVEKAGGTSCISGIAAAHAMQKSIQKNKARVIALFQTAAKGHSDE